MDKKALVQWIMDYLIEVDDKAIINLLIEANGCKNHEGSVFYNCSTCEHYTYNNIIRFRLKGLARNETKEM